MLYSKTVRRGIQSRVWWEVGGRVREVDSICACMHVRRQCARAMEAKSIRDTQKRTVGENEQRSSESGRESSELRERERGGKMPFLMAVLV